MATVQAGPQGTSPYLVLTVTETGTSQANNTSTVSFSLILHKPYAPSGTSSKSWSCSINGQNYSGTVGNINGSGTQTLKTGTQTIPHNADGSKTISLSCSIGLNLTWSGNWVGTISGSGSMVLTKITRTFTVSYNANGGSGAPGNQTKTYGVTLKLSSTIPTRSGYIFQGWGTSASTTTVSYNPGSNYTGNANLTLYAIWSSVNLIKLNVTSKNLTIPSTSDGYANPGNTNLSYSPISDSTNYSVNFYYKICYVDNINGEVFNLNTNSFNKTYGPFTAKDIGDGISDPNANYIPLNSDVILESLKNCRNDTQVKFLVAVSTTNNTFANNTTSKSIVTCNLTDFNILWIKVLECFRTSNGLQAKVQVKFPKSYTAMTSYRLPSIRIDNSESIITPSGTSTKGTDNLITYILNLPNTQINSSAHNLKLEISDNIANAIGYTRIGAIGSEDIYIYKDTNICKCVEFIESDEVQFQKGGRVYANEFIETDDGVFIGDTMMFGELVEE